jgi:hypothetical protein
MLSETNRNGGRLFSSLRAVLSSLRALAADPTQALSELHHKRWTTWDGARSGMYALAETSDAALSAEKKCA